MEKDTELSDAKETKDEDGAPTCAKARADFIRAFQYKKRFLDQADNDFITALGQQWDEDDVKKLEDRGIKALSINKISPIIRLMKGIESQNRSDPKAYPEGKEDSIEAEIASGLLKNACKSADANYEISDLFDDGNTCGESFLEPFLDYNENILVGKLKLRKTDYWNVFPDPDAKKYDFSDGEFVCKITYDLTLDQVLMMFPDDEDKLEALESGKFSMSQGRGNETNMMGIEIQRRGYDQSDDTNTPYQREDKTYDLLEYIYKRYVAKWYIGDKVLGGIKQCDSEKEAKAYAKAQNDLKPDTVAVIKRFVPEIWVKSIIGGMEEELSDVRHWAYPRWKSWPIIPYYAYKSSARISNKYRHLKVQGIVRQLKDLQFSYNKRKMQELVHLNQSANSGWLAEDGAWVDEKKVEKFGATSGINLYYKKDHQIPQKLTPTPLSQAHAQIAAENSADMKEASGINTDLLAQVEGGTDSGRAIALRQKQGLTMVQGLFDNLGRTKNLFYRFVMSQLSEMYTIETAQRVMGESFMSENFMKPKMATVMGPNGQPIVDPSTGQPAMQPIMDPMSGQPVMEPDTERANQVFNQVLNDTEAGDYDLAITDVVSSETMQYANYTLLTDLVTKGLPIPPDVLIDASPLPEGSKKKINAALQAAQAAAVAGGKQPGGK